MKEFFGQALLLAYFVDRFRTSPVDALTTVLEFNMAEKAALIVTLVWVIESIRHLF